MESLFVVDVEKMMAILVLLILHRRTVSAAWSVTFENQDPCALKGSSVEFRCSYDYEDGETIKNTAWFKGQLHDGHWKRVKLSDLPSYQNRSEYLGDLQHDCSLAIHDVQANDTGYYYFRFDTQMYGRRSRESVYLSVTELSARIYPDNITAGDIVTLECETSCQLPGIVWFKDGRPVAKPEFQAQAEDAGNYVCAVKGQESLPSYPVALDVKSHLLNVSVEESYVGHVTINSRVNVTCSSAADSGLCQANNSAEVLLPADETDSRLLNVSVEESYVGHVTINSSVNVTCSSAADSGLCQANNSAEVLLPADETDFNRLVLIAGIGVKVIIILLLTLVIWVWRWRISSPAVDIEENLNDYENFSTVYMDQKITQMEVSV